MHFVVTSFFLGFTLEEFHVKMWLFGIAVELLLGMPTFLIRMPGFKSGFQVGQTLEDSRWGSSR